MQVFFGCHPGFETMIEEPKLHVWTHLECKILVFWSSAMKVSVTMTGWLVVYNGEVKNDIVSVEIPVLLESHWARTLTKSSGLSYFQFQPQLSWFHDYLRSGKFFVKWKDLLWFDQPIKSQVDYILCFHWLIENSFSRKECLRFTQPWFIDVCEF